MNWYNQGKAKDEYSFAIRVFENNFSPKLKTLSERKRPKDTPPI